ncbi:hypothetical protein K3495_g2973 [Podosphaera aphanis]|nr:hypothetical protein K3495_g2973 [Podosphaera aphanis]
MELITLKQAAIEDLDIEALDVDTAFLNPKLYEEVYMKIPDFFALQHPGINRKKYYLKFNKSLYGLKQAPHAWFQEVKEHFKQIGLKGGDSDPNLFIGRGVYVLFYVDDMLVIGPTEKVKVLKSDIVRRWKCKILGPVDTFVGIQVERNREKRMLRIHQTAYIVKLLQRLKMDKSIPKNLSLPAGTVLNRPTEDDPWKLLNTTEAGLYRQIVGSVLYLSNGTRSDIAYAVGQLARLMSNPNSNHLSIAKHLLKYLNGTRTFEILYQATKETKHWTSWTDATWGKENDKKIFSGTDYHLERGRGNMVFNSAEKHGSEFNGSRNHVCKRRGKGNRLDGENCK